jgi:hypothetical protein
MNLVSLAVFWLFCARALVCLYLIRPQRFYGSCSDNRTAKNPGDVLVHLVHLGRGTLQVVWALMFFCVSLLSNASSFTVTWVLGEVDRPSSLLSPVPPSLGSRRL